VRKKTAPEDFRCCLFVCGLALGAHLSEALAAVYRTVGLGLEGNLGLAAATGAGSGEELTGTTSGVLASVTASLAALGLVLEAALSVELLLTSGENEFVAALFAN
jgi:enamine deaminase RidA (YjgF/YER057c/UK114 family)